MRIANWFDFSIISKTDNPNQAKNGLMEGPLNNINKNELIWWSRYVLIDFEVKKFSDLKKPGKKQLF